MQCHRASSDLFGQHGRGGPYVDGVVRSACRVAQPAVGSHQLDPTGAQQVRLVLLNVPPGLLHQLLDMIHADCYALLSHLAKAQLGISGVLTAIRQAVGHC